MGHIDGYQATEGSDDRVADEDGIGFGAPRNRLNRSEIVSD